VKEVKLSQEQKTPQAAEGQTTSEAAEKNASKTIWRRLFMREGIRSALLLPLLSVLTALVIGAVILTISSPKVLEAWGNFGQNPGRAIGLTFTTVFTAYAALFEGAFGSPVRMITAFGVLFSSGETRPLLDAFRPLSESLVISTPYIFAGLAVALGFRGGLFNIGAEGQLFVAGLASVYVGYALQGLPWIIHLPLAILAGILAGAVWGAVPGFLKAQTGAHEEINTNMMN
jgi:simple sugar transport system permease protein